VESEKAHGDNRVQHAVAEEFKAFIVDGARAAVGQGRAQKLRVVKSVIDSGQGIPQGFTSIQQCG
jgi:hypothetical protein